MRRNLGIELGLDPSGHAPEQSGLELSEHSALTRVDVGLLPSVQVQRDESNTWEAGQREKILNLRKKYDRLQFINCFLHFIYFSAFSLASNSVLGRIVVISGSSERSVSVGSVTSVPGEVQALVQSASLPSWHLQ